MASKGGEMNEITSREGVGLALLVIVYYLLPYRSASIQVVNINLKWVPSTQLPCDNNCDTA